MTALTPKSFEKEVLESDLPVLVKATATWCSPCKLLAPTLKKFSEEREGKLKIVEMDVDKCSAIADKYKVLSIPMFLLFVGGKQLKFDPLLTGVMPKSELARRVDARLKQASDEAAEKAATRAAKKAKAL